jgi:hypothetical protein
MSERKYRVFVNDRVVASNMDLRDATILVRALFEEYNNEHNILISINEEERIMAWTEEK